jgi:succinoglycan biosynthesis protein ExoM
MRPQVSICIATYRRPESLANLLDSLERLKLPDGVSVEILVVDNDVSKTAEPIALEYAPRFERFEYSIETRQNIAHARNCAVERAQGEWLAFVDDDERADENWICALLSTVGEHECDGAFGPVLPRLEQRGSGWLDLEAFYSRPRQVSGTRVSHGNTRSGNALLRRALFRELRFDPDYGRTGGSDVDLFGRMLDRGACFLWCDEAIVHESLGADRHNLRWLARRAFRGGFVFETQHPTPRRSFALLRALTLGLGFALLAPMVLLSGPVPAARVALRSCTQAGRAWSLLGGWFEEYRG